MHAIDKRRFGAFVAGLRRERGLTQKELAERLFISDKAVSKWETGASIPDTGLLIPLAELLGVTVTELLLSERRAEEDIPAAAAETAVQAAIAYSGGEYARAYTRRTAWGLVYALALAAAAAECFLLHARGLLTDMPATIAGLAAVFGAYFCFFARTKLPAYFDENRVGAYSDGILRINLPGVSFNNNNWPHVLNVGRAWSVAVMALLPLFYLLRPVFPEALWLAAELPFVLVFALGGLFAPMWIVCRRHA